jgi:hypothetical protein
MTALRAGVDAARTLVAASLTPGDWINIAVGLASAIVVIGVAWIERRQNRRDQRMGRAQHIQHLNRTGRRLRYDVWRLADLAQIREMLDLGDDLVHAVLERGPLSDVDLQLLGVERFRVRTAQLSNRIVGPQAQSVRELSDLATRLAQTGLPTGVSDPDCPDRPADTPCPRGLQRLAIFQDRTARELREQIRAARLLAERDWVG